MDPDLDVLVEPESGPEGCSADKAEGARLHDMEFGLYPRLGMECHSASLTKGVPKRLQQVLPSHMLFQCDLERPPLRGGVHVPPPELGQGLGLLSPKEVELCDCGRQVVQRIQLCPVCPFQDAFS